VAKVAEILTGAVGPVIYRQFLIIHGTADDVVPVEHALKLFALVREPKELVLLESAGHRLRQVPEAVEKALAWLSDRIM
jgi:fermentation-respiration switch protein FrsA (DUF1100 family)